MGAAGDGAAPPAPPIPAWAAADPLAGELWRELGEALVEVEGGGDGGRALTIQVRREDVARVAAALRSRFRYTVLVDLCAADRPERPLRFEIVYHLYSFRENRRIRLKVRTGEGLPVPSVTGVWRGAGWPEREAHDLFGIELSGHPELTRILLWDGFAGHPLRKDFPLAGLDTGAALTPDAGDLAGMNQGAAVAPDPPGAGELAATAAKSEVVELAFGPRHPALQGVLRLRLALDGDEITDCRPRIGYLHRGLEKLFEGFTLRDGVALTDRLDFVAAAAANLAYAGAVERLLGLAVPPRARFLRVVLAELQRIASHLLWLATHAADAGAEDAFLPCLRDRERVLDLLAAYCGARVTLRCAVPGGLPRDVPAGWVRSCAELAAALPDRVAAYRKLPGEDRCFRERTAGLGVLSPETALDHGVTGPMLRATGVDWDLRKALPYDAYGELELEVVVARNGDAYDRCQVRLAELLQSASLIAQCLERLPPGPVRFDPGVAGAAGALSDSAALSAQGPESETYFGVEGPRGEVGFYLVAGPRAADSSPPWRCHVRAPSFYNLQALPEMVRGHGVGDLVVLLGSLDLALGEVDR
jgi:NADH/F420H2 dehydrogenase subunit C